MKNLLFVLFVFSNYFLFSQKIDIKNIDYNKLESKIFSQINSYRKKINIDTVAPSSVTKTYISKVNVKKMVDSDMLFHPDYSTTGATFVSELFNEYSKMFKGKFTVEEYNSPFVSQSAEIILSMSCTSEDCLTYDEFAKKSLECWLNSPGHKKIIHTSYKNFSGLPGLGSCSVAVKNGTFYVAFNFFTFVPVF